MGYLTGDTSTATTYKCRRVRIPDDLALIAAVTGALIPLTKASSWESSGSATPEECAALMDTMFYEFLDSLEDCV